MKRIGLVVLATLAAACSSSGGQSAAPTKSNTATSSADTVASGAATACTTSDLGQTGAVPMPRPVRIAHTRVFEHGHDRLDPPPASARPAANPNAIWRASRAYQTPVGSYELVLASFSAFVPSIGGIPEFQHVLAWIVVAHHFPSTPTGGGVSAPGAATTPSPTCDFVIVLDVFDAQSAKPLALIEGA